MGKGLDLELLRDMMKDTNDVSILLARIDKLALANDRSALRVLCTIIPDNIEMVARMSWQSVGPNAGIFAFPSPNDLVLLGLVDSDEDQAFVFSRLTSKEDLIPLQAVDGSTVIRALAGKKTHVLSDTRINLGKGGSEPTEPLVLGTTFQTGYKAHLDADIAHTHIGNLGFDTAVPSNVADYQAVKASPVDDDAMLSDLTFTEK